MEKKKYLDLEGLKHLLEKISKAVDESGGGFIEMEEEIPIIDRKKNVLYGLILVDFETKGGA